MWCATANSSSVGVQAATDTVGIASRHGRKNYSDLTKEYLHTGTLQLPGGHLENGETWTECAKREVLEETGIELTRPVDFLTATNDVFDEIKHYVTIFMVAKLDDCHVEPQVCRMSQGRTTAELIMNLSAFGVKVLEPDKCQSWEWMSLGSLQRLYHDDRGHLFLPLINLLRERRDQVEAALGSS